MKLTLIILLFLIYYLQTECFRLNVLKFRALTIKIAKFPELDINTDNPLVRKTPKPNIISPSRGTKENIEKFMMMYTCKLCTGRNAQMVSKVAYSRGMVVSTCKHCKKLHLIADNEGKLDMAEYGKKIEQYLEKNGEKVQRLSLSPEDIENNYLIDQDGKIILVPKMSGQPSSDSTIIEFPNMIKK